MKWTASGLGRGLWVSDIDRDSSRFAISFELDSKQPVSAAHAVMRRA